MRLQLHWQIIIALILAVTVGSVIGKDTTLLGINFFSVLSFIGTLFINALKMIIVPLVVSSIIVGIAGVSRLGAAVQGRVPICDRRQDT